MRPDKLERQLRERPDAFPPAARAGSSPGLRPCNACFSFLTEVATHRQQGCSARIGEPSAPGSFENVAGGLARCKSFDYCFNHSRARRLSPNVVVSWADTRTSPEAPRASMVKMYRCDSSPGGGHGPP
jgi:hypothetical protein